MQLHLITFKLLQISPLWSQQRHVAYCSLFVYIPSSEPQQDFTPSSLWQLLIPCQLMLTIENRLLANLSISEESVEHNGCYYLFFKGWLNKINGHDPVITRTCGAKLLPQVLHWISFWIGGASPSATRNQTVVKKDTHMHLQCITQSILFIYYFLKCALSLHVVRIIIITVIVLFCSLDSIVV